MQWFEATFGRRIVIILAVGIATALASSAPVFGAQGETGKKRCTDGIDNDGDNLVDIADPDCNEGGGASGGSAAITLEVAVHFDGVMSMIGPFDAVVECGSGFCEYHALPPGGILNLPVSFADIIDATSFRGTELDANLCYNFDGLGLRISDLSHVFMRVYNDPSEGWDFYVDGMACDMDSAVFGECSERQYQQRFRGVCDPSGCDRIDNLGVGDARQYVGFYLNTWSSGPDQKYGTPCRCTMSNSPDCPDDVGLPSPPVTVTVERVAAP